METFYAVVRESDGSYYAGDGKYSSSVLQALRIFSLEDAEKIRKALNEQGDCDGTCTAVRVQVDYPIILDPTTGVQAVSSVGTIITSSEECHYNGDLFLDGANICCDDISYNCRNSRWFAQGRTCSYGNPIVSPVVEPPSDSGTSRNIGVLEPDSDNLARYNGRTYSEGAVIYLNETVYRASSGLWLASGSTPTSIAMLGEDSVENPDLIDTARIWQQESDPSTPPQGSWRLTSKNVITGRRNGRPWLYAELQRRDHNKGWRANLQEIDLSVPYSNMDGNLQRE
jgi:hypothetical protein